MDNLKGLLVFYLGDLEFCADMKDITTTIKVDKLGINYPVTKIDNMRLMIDKEEVQIINLHKLFGITLTRFDHNTRIFVYEQEEIKFGFFVDHVSELLTIDRKVTRLLEFLTPKSNEFLLSIIKFEGREFYFPDYYKIARNFIVQKTN